MDFTGKVVAITGAAGGIGQALCRHFGGQGAVIAALDRSEAVTDLIPTLAGEGIKAEGWVVDITDADAVGLEVPERCVVVRTDQPFHLDLVTEALATVYDPEIPISIVDLGLVYRCEEVVEDGSRRIEIDMTMTAPGCGMGDVLRDEAQRVVEQVPGVDRADIELVFDPPWSMERISEDARLELGLY